MATPWRTAPAPALDQLLERKCDAIIVCQGLMASETIIYLHQKGIQLAQDIDLVSFVDYDSDVYALYANQMDSIIQPVEDLGQAAGRADPQTGGGARRADL